MSGPSIAVTGVELSTLREVVRFEASTALTSLEAALGRHEIEKANNRFSRALAALRIVGLETEADDLSAAVRTYLSGLEAELQEADYA